MIRLFDIVGGKPVPSDHCYLLDSLSKIMDIYKDDAVKVYGYLFYMTCPNPDLNPFFDLKESEKEEYILKELNIDVSLDESAVVEALQFCRTLYTTPTARAYEGVKIALDNMTEFMATEKPTSGRDGSATTLLRIAEKFDSVRQSFKGVYKDLIDEQQSSVRGGQRLAYDQ